MPSRADDKYFGGKRGAAQKAYASMVEQYGAKKAEQVYFAVLNRNKKRMSLRGTLHGRSPYRKPA